jgi:hypothetical protein
MDSPHSDKDELDALFRTFQDDSETDEGSVSVPAPHKPAPKVGGSAIALPEPDDDLDDDRS